MKTKRTILTGFATVAVAGLIAGTTQTAQASSHREAPLIAEDPAADNTDEAIRWIERARDEHDATFVYIRAATEAANLVQDDRVTAAMERVGLP